MDVKHYRDLDGNWYREIVNSKYTPLQELEDQYRAKGHKTWLNPFDETKWVLTVLTGKEQ